MRIRRSYYVIYNEAFNDERCEIYSSYLVHHHLVFEWIFIYWLVKKNNNLEDEKQQLST